MEPNKIIKLKDVASLFCNDDNLYSEILNIEISKTLTNRKSQVITIIQIIKKIKEKIEHSDIVIYGLSEVLIDIRVSKESSNIALVMKTFIVSIILFLGAAIAIINFHEDVNMTESLSSIYEIVTGQKENKPLILLISYSIGLGVGMITFFNQVFKKKWKKEPSPLELEMHNYKKNLDEYVLDITKHNNR
ncbi:MAG: stage V sporulation protein AA [Firmicutes bacterium]|nr:stage V sporulation protein AA [Bacillota bacterium]